MNLKYRFSLRKSLVSKRAIVLAKETTKRMKTITKQSCFERQKTMMTFVPYLIVVFGVVSDFITTRIGLSRSFYETHVNYSPFTAFSIFMVALIALEFVLGKLRYKRLGMSLIACMSLLGAVNNILVILGVFGGLHL